MKLIESLKEDLPELSIILNENELEYDLRSQVALYLYQKGYISSGLAAQYIGTTRVEFLLLAGKKKIPMYEYTKEDLARELDED